MRPCLVSRARLACASRVRVSTVSRAREDGEFVSRAREDGEFRSDWTGAPGCVRFRAGGLQAQATWVERLPPPSDVGEALAAYLRGGLMADAQTRVFRANPGAAGGDHVEWTTQAGAMAADWRKRNRPSPTALPPKLSQS